MFHWNIKSIVIIMIYSNNCENRCLSMPIAWSAFSQFYVDIHHHEPSTKSKIAHKCPPLSTTASFFLVIGNKRKKFLDSIFKLYFFHCTMSRNSLNISEGKRMKSGTSKMQLKSPKLSVCRSRETWRIKISEENFV